MTLSAIADSLKVVPIDRVRLHEGFDPWRVKRVIVSMRHRGVMKNPLVVAEREDDYIVLDGATRTTALRRMRIPHVVVQVVSYTDPGICLSGWHHILIGLPAERLLALFRQIPGLVYAPRPSNDLLPHLQAKQSLFGLITRDGGSYAFQSDLGSGRDAQLLSTAVATYRGKAEVHRTAELDLPTLINQNPELSAVVVFPVFTPEDVIHFALNEAKLPMGITRHIIHGRVLGLNVPLDLLASDRSLSEKNVWLQDLIRKRFRRHNVRTYEESTIVFDE